MTRKDLTLSIPIAQGFEMVVKKAGNVSPSKKMIPSDTNMRGSPTKLNFLGKNLARSPEKPKKNLPLVNFGKVLPGKKPEGLGGSPTGKIKLLKEISERNDDKQPGTKDGDSGRL